MRSSHGLHDESLKSRVRYLLQDKTAIFSLLWITWIQPTSSHPISWRSTLIFSCLSSGLPSGLFPSGVLIKTPHASLCSPIRTTHHVYPMLHHPNDVLYWGVYATKLLFMHISPVSVLFTSPWFQISSSAGCSGKPVDQDLPLIREINFHPPIQNNITSVFTNSNIYSRLIASKQKRCLTLRYELYHLLAFVHITRSQLSASITGAGKQSANENVRMKARLIQQKREIKYITQTQFILALLYDAFTTVQGS